MPSFWMYSNTQCSTPLREVDSWPTISTHFARARIKVMSMDAFRGQVGVA